MASSSSGRKLPVDKPSQHHEQQQHQPPLNCPRCDSSNTKFCYYNNYSLSQPRHFCKACKRYWTRGGTLRNVPVGGGCRKNKRIRRPSSTASTTTVSATAAATSGHPHPPQTAAVRSSLDTRSAAHLISPLFFDMGGVSYPSSLGLGFSPPGFLPNDHGSGENINYLHDTVSSGPVPSGGYSSDAIRCLSAGMTNAPIFGSTSPTTTAMTSLLASTIQQQKFFNADLKDAPPTALGDFKGFSFQGSGDVGVTENEFSVKEIKPDGLNVPGWSFGYQNQIEVADPSPHYWNISSNNGSWHDPANNGPSVHSLI